MTYRHLRLDATTRKRLNALSRCAAGANEWRSPALRCIGFDAEGAWAMDGFRLGHVALDTGLASSGTVAPSILVDAARFSKALRHATRLTDMSEVRFGIDEVRVVTWRDAGTTPGGEPRYERLVEVALPVTDAEFPNPRHVMPSDEDRHAGTDTAKRLRAAGVPTVDPLLLAELSAVHGTPGVMLEVDAERPRQRPVTVWGEEGEFVGILMPRRHYADNDPAGEG